MPPQLSAAKGSTLLATFLTALCRSAGRTRQHFTLKIAARRRQQGDGEARWRNRKDRKCGKTIPSEVLARQNRAQAGMALHGVLLVMMSSPLDDVRTERLRSQSKQYLLVQTDSGGSLSARWKPLWQGQMLAPRAPV